MQNSLSIVRLGALSAAFTLLFSAATVAQTSANASKPAGQNSSDAKAETIINGANRVLKDLATIAASPTSVVELIFIIFKSSFPFHCRRRNTGVPRLLMSAGWRCALQNLGNAAVLEE